MNDQNTFYSIHKSKPRSDFCIYFESLTFRNKAFQIINNFSVDSTESIENQKLSYKSMFFEAVQHSIQLITKSLEITDNQCCLQVKDF